MVPKHDDMRLLRSERPLRPWPAPGSRADPVQPVLEEDLEGSHCPAGRELDEQLPRMAKADALVPVSCFEFELQPHRHNLLATPLLHLRGLVLAQITGYTRISEDILCGPLRVRILRWLREDVAARSFGVVETTEQIAEAPHGDAAQENISVDIGDPHDMAQLLQISETRNQESRGVGRPVVG